MLGAWYRSGDRPRQKGASPLSKAGVPTQGGIAFGLDRLIMLLGGADSSAM